MFYRYRDKEHRYEFDTVPADPVKYASRLHWRPSANAGKVPGFLGQVAQDPDDSDSEFDRCDFGGITENPRSDRSPGK